MIREIVDIIADDIAGELISVEEQVYLKEWRSLSSENEMFYSAMTTLKEQRIVMRGRTQSDLLYQNIENKINRRAKIKKLKRAYGIAVGIMLAIGVSVFLFDEKEQRHLPLQQQVAHINPGTRKAELTLADGRKVQLESGSKTVILSDSLSKVINDDNTLVYGNISGQYSQSEEYHMINVPTGGEYNLILADGTKVYLNSGSHLRYPAMFSGNQREVFLTGEAYFEVTSDLSRPFIVQADQLRIRVLGTSFNVTAYPDQDHMATTLEKGKIRILHNDQDYDVTPGKQAVLHKTSGQLVIREVETALYTSWKDGYYYFEDTSLEEIMSMLALWYNMEIFYQNPEVKKIRFGGKFKRYEDIGYLFGRFAETNEVEFIVKGNYVTIKSK